MKLPTVGALDSIGILFTLLPGLVSLLVVRALTARERRIDATDAVLHGLAYTLVVHAIWQVLNSIGSLIPTPDVVGLSLSAVGLGVIVAWVTNRGVAYGILQKMGVTQEGAWATTWETSFRQFRIGQGEYAVFHLRDGRRIMGAIRGHSAQQTEGHVCLERAKWLGGNGTTELQGPLLLCAEDIMFVEFLPFAKEPVDARIKQANHPRTPS